MVKPEIHDRPLLHGRRKGHPLSPRRRTLVDTLMPRLRLDLAAPPPAPLSGLFPRPVDDIWLEIGFGAGEHLAWQARHNAAIGLIGVEPFLNGLASLLARIQDDGVDNIRLHDGDARAILEWLPAASLGRVFVLFPDPWPKKRHHKRRLLSRATLRALARVLRPGGELRIATDWRDYVRAILVAAAQVDELAWQAERPGDWRTRPADWPPTRYETKAARAGRASAYLRFVRG